MPFLRYTFCCGSKIGEMAVQNAVILACAAHVFEVSGLDAVARKCSSNSYMDCSSERCHFIDWAVLFDG